MEEKSRERDDLVTEAEAAESRGDFAAAVELLKIAAAVAPDERLRQRLRVLTDRKRRFDEHCEKARASERAGDIQRALAGYEAAAMVNPHAEWVVEKMRDIRDRLETLRAVDDMRKKEDDAGRSDAATDADAGEDIDAVLKELATDVAAGRHRGGRRERRGKSSSRLRRQAGESRRRRLLAYPREAVTFGLLSWVGFASYPVWILAKDTARNIAGGFLAGLFFNLLFGPLAVASGWKGLSHAREEEWSRRKKDLSLAGLALGAVGAVGGGVLLLVCLSQLRG